VQKGSKPRRIVTGLHKRTHIFGFLSEDKKKMFMSSDKMNAKSFLNALYKFRKRFTNIILIIDRAPWHRAKRIKKYLDKYRREIKIIWFPKGCPEMNPVEECWRQTRNNVTANKAFSSCDELRKELRRHWSRQKFQHKSINYLLP